MPLLRISPSMRPAEVAAARARLDLSHADLSERFGIPEHEVRGWEDGTVSVPRRVAKRLAWEAAVAEREEAFASTGLECCDWQAGWEAELERIHQDHEAVRRHLREFDEHQEKCDACRARRAWEEKQPSLPDPPVDGWVGLLAGSVERVQRLPAWLRPAAYGAAGVGALTLFKAAVTMLFTGPSWTLLGMALIGVVIGAVLGAVGGVTYALVREPFRRFGRAGDYLTGVVCVAAYMMPFALLMAAAGLDPETPAGVIWGSFAFCALLFGLFIGHTWFREA